MLTESHTIEQLTLSRSISDNSRPKYKVLPRNFMGIGRKSRQLVQLSRYTTTHRVTQDKRTPLFILSETLSFQAKGTNKNCLNEESITDLAFFLASNEVFNRVSKWGNQKIGP